MTFNDLVDEAARQIHDALLRGGSKEMKSVLFSYMSTAANFKEEQKRKK